MHYVMAHLLVRAAGAVISVSDVGFGTIVGSAVFNVLFVIGLCGFAAQVSLAFSRNGQQQFVGSASAADLFF